MSATILVLKLFKEIERLKQVFSNILYDAEAGAVPCGSSPDPLTCSETSWAKEVEIITILTSFDILFSLGSWVILYTVKYSKCLGKWLRFRINVFEKNINMLNKSYVKW